MTSYEALRYDYPLTTASTVIDAGVFEGNFAHIIHTQYGCKILGFEPVKSFFLAASARLKQFPSIHLYNFGLGGTTRRQKFYIKGSMTGMFTDHVEQTEEVEIKAIAGILEPMEICDLIKLNIEGMEYEVLEAVIDAMLQKRLRNIQVQFHYIPDAEKRFERIHATLLKTHRLTFNDPFWSNYELR